jgi:hypothetical protein
MHTPNLAAGIIASVLISAVASLFDWYVMRRGTLLMGDEGSSFSSDLRSLPPLVLSFVLEPSAWAWRSTLQWFGVSEAEAE